MSELTTKIGPFNAETRTVSVTFTSGDIVYKREVNAVLEEDGSYDRKGTKQGWPKSLRVSRTRSALASSPFRRPNRNCPSRPNP